MRQGKPTLCSVHSPAISAVGVSGGRDGHLRPQRRLGKGGALYMRAAQSTDRTLIPNSTLGGTGSTYELGHFSGNGGNALGSGIYT